MCVGTGDMDKPTALVQIDAAALIKWADASGVAYASVEALCESPAAEKYVLEELNTIGKAGNLGANEILAGVTLVAGTGEMDRGAGVAPQQPRSVDACEQRADRDEQAQPQAALEKFFAAQMPTLIARASGTDRTHARAARPDACARGLLIFIPMIQPASSRPQRARSGPSVPPSPPLGVHFKDKTQPRAHAVLSLASSCSAGHGPLRNGLHPPPSSASGAR